MATSGEKKRRRSKKKKKSHSKGAKGQSSESNNSPGAEGDAGSGSDSGDDSGASSDSTVCLDDEFEAEEKALVAMEAVSSKLNWSIAGSARVRSPVEDENVRRLAEMLETVSGF